MKKLTETQRKHILEALHSLHDMLHLPDIWCKGAIARDSKGTAVKSSNKDAVAWCSYGMLLVMENKAFKVSPGKIDEFFFTKARTSLGSLNDTKGRLAVIQKIHQVLVQENYQG